VHFVPIGQGARFSLAVTSNALELGSPRCWRYFDPATYRQALAHGAFDGDPLADYGVTAERRG
jgi:hypothetical protein